MLHRWLLCVVVGLFAMACSSHASPGASGAGDSAGVGGRRGASGAGDSAGSGGKPATSGAGAAAGKTAASGSGGLGAAGKPGASGSGGLGAAGKPGSGGSGAAGKPAASGSGGAAGTAAVGGLTWRQASLTNFTSYPDPGSDECIKYNGCMWAGQFAAVDGKQTEAWVMAHNIVAVHSKDFGTYKLKTLRLRKDGHELDVTVYDECADSDCSGCCTENAKPSGFLIDVEKYTAQRFGVDDGQVDWACLDCP